MYPNMIVNILVYMLRRLEKCTAYCISCGKKLADEAFRLSPCTNPFCMFKFEEIFGVKLFSELQSNRDLVELDLSLTSKALFSARAYDIVEPFPSFFLRDKEERERSAFGKGTGNIHTFNKENKDIEGMRAIFSHLPSITDLKASITCEVRADISRSCRAR